MKVRMHGVVHEMKTVWLEGDSLRMIDQRFLPEGIRILSAGTVGEVARAIENMAVRGAPAIGATAAYGMAVAQLAKEDIEKANQRLQRTRPTGRDLFHALEVMMDAWRAGEDLVATSRKYAAELEKSCIAIGRHGSDLLKDGSRILTHCNAGALATVDHGTALAPIRHARSNGKKLFVYVSETRPRLQGAQLTAWELSQEDIEHVIVADSASGTLMVQGFIDIVIVGADRIAANGDTANKIGTYEKAVLAKENRVPFYVAAPTNTIDFAMRSGKDVPIEERDEEEVLNIRGVRIAPKESRALNPAFDVTPAKYISGFITEKGILQSKMLRSLKPKTR